jgi:hypothetical protein
VGSVLRTHFAGFTVQCNSSVIRNSCGLRRVTCLVLISVCVCVCVCVCACMRACVTFFYSKERRESKNTVYVCVHACARRIPKNSVLSVYVSVLPVRMLQERSTNVYASVFTVCCSSLLSIFMHTFALNIETSTARFDIEIIAQSVDC